MAINKSVNKCRVCMIGNAHMINIYEKTKLYTDAVSNILSLCTGIKITKGDGLPEFMCGKCLCLLGVVHKYLAMAKQSDDAFRTSIENVNDTIEKMNKLYQNDIHKQSNDNVGNVERPPITEKEKSMADELNCSAENIIYPILTDNSMIATKNNGIPDITLKPTDNNGIPDLTLKPTDNNGILDVTLKPTDNNGIPDVTLKPTDNNGILDVTLKPTDNNGILDVTLKQTDTNGSIVTHETDNNKISITNESGSDEIIPTNESDIPFKSTNNNGMILYEDSLNQTDNDEVKIKKEVESLLDILDGDDDDDYSLIDLSEMNQEHLANDDDSTQEEWAVEYLEPEEQITEIAEDNKDDSTLSKQFMCSMCNRSFEKIIGLSNHLRTHVVDVVPQQMEPFYCKTCNKTFKFRSKYMEHTYIHNNIKPFQCTTCQKRFMTPTTLKLHKNSVHNKIRPFPCYICKKPFSQKTELIGHIRTHTNEKPFECSFCKKSFALKKYLRYHENMHTGNRPYKCEFCPRGFTRPTGLQIHRRTHTGERPYKCNICFKTFASIGSRSQHQRLHALNIL